MCVVTYDALFLIIKHIMKSTQNRKLKHTTTTITSISPSSKSENTHTKLSKRTDTQLLMNHMNDFKLQHRVFFFLHVTWTLPL